VVDKNIVVKTSDSDIQHAVNAVKNGSLVAFPTETVYGLGADASNPKAISRIFDVKGRPKSHPLIVHSFDSQILDSWCVEVPEIAWKLAEAFWPGPMTLVLKRSSLVSDLISGGQSSVAIRVPDNLVALDFLKKTSDAGIPGIAAPSANRFGHVSPTSAQAVLEEIGSYLGNSDLIIDGGSTKIGIESTIINVHKNAVSILRPGAITSEMIMNETSSTLIPEISNLRVSGSLANHYSPAAKVLLDILPEPGDGLIADSSFETPVGVIRLAAPKDAEAFAQVLYSALRKADKMKIPRVVVIQPTGGGISIAIRDRLIRASHGQ
jgi:L-threonylcarbamoyladenylate synthase